MDFHAKVPLAALLGLVDFGITIAGLVLGGARRRNGGGINSTAFMQNQAVFLLVLVHLFEQRLAKTVVLQEMSEVENGGPVRQTVRKSQTFKAMHGFDLVQRTFIGRIAKVIEQLRAVDSQHGRQPIGRRPAFLAPWDKNGRPSSPAVSGESTLPTVPERSRGGSYASCFGTRLGRGLSDPWW